MARRPLLAALAAAGIAAAGLSGAAPASAASPVPPPSASFLFCSVLGLPIGTGVDVTPTAGRVVTLTNTDTGEYIGRALVLRERYAERNPESTWVDNVYPGPRRNVVECYYGGSGVYELTVSMLGR